MLSSINFSAPIALTIEPVSDIPLGIVQSLDAFFVAYSNEKTLKKYISTNESFIFDHHQGNNLKQRWSDIFKKYAEVKNITVYADQPKWPQLHKKYIAYLQAKLNEANDTDVDMSDAASNVSGSTASSSASSASSTGARKLNIAAWTDYKNKLLNIDSSNKFIIPGQRHLEDIVYDVGLTYPKENLAQSFILDTDDVKYLQVLTKKQLRYVATSGLADIPPTSNKLSDAIQSIMNKGFDEAFKLAKVQLVNLTTKDEEHPFILTIVNCCTNYELGAYHRSNASELDTMIDLWIHIIDTHFKHSKEFTGLRGEKTSQASRKRKQQQRQTEARAPMGKRADLLVVGAQGVYEYAYGEGSRIANPAAPKNQQDSKLKTIKTMKDMLLILMDSVGGASPLLRTVGYQCSQQMLTVMVMDCIGCTMRVRNLRPVRLSLKKEEFITSLCYLYQLANKSLLICQETERLVQSANARLNLDDYDDIYAASSDIPAGMKTPPQDNKRQKTM